MERARTTSGDREGASWVFSLLQFHFSGLPYCLHRTLQLLPGGAHVL